MTANVLALVLLALLAYISSQIIRELSTAVRRFMVGHEYFIKIYLLGYMHKYLGHNLNLHKY